MHCQQIYPIPHFYSSVCSHLHSFERSHLYSFVCFHWYVYSFVYLLIGVDVTTSFGIWRPVCAMFVFSFPISFSFKNIQRTSTVKILYSSDINQVKPLCLCRLFTCYNVMFAINFDVLILQSRSRRQDCWRSLFQDYQFGNSVSDNSVLHQAMKSHEV